MVLVQSQLFYFGVGFCSWQFQNVGIQIVVAAWFMVTAILYYPGITLFQHFRSCLLLNCIHLQEISVSLKVFESTIVSFSF